MIGQYLSNKNESATVPKILKFCQLNKASVDIVFDNITITLHLEYGGINLFLLLAFHQALVRCRLGHLDDDKTHEQDQHHLMMGLLVQPCTCEKHARRLGQPRHHARHYCHPPSCVVIALENLWTLVGGGKPPRSPSIGLTFAANNTTPWSTLTSEHLPDALLRSDSHARVAPSTSTCACGLASLSLALARRQALRASSRSPLQWP